MIIKEFIMKMLICLLAGVFFRCLTPCLAQSDSVRVPDRYWAIDLKGGLNIDLYSGRSDVNADLMSSRKNSAFVGSWHVRQLFSDRWGWYAGFGAIGFQEEKSDYILDNKLYNGSDALAETIGSVFLYPKYFVDAGMLYRLKRKRWELLPHAGLGAHYYFYQEDREKERDGAAGIVQRYTYHQKSGFVALHLGIGTNYFVTERSYLSFGIDVQQPLNAMNATYTYAENGHEISRVTYKSAGIGCNLNLTVGYGFVFGRKIRRNI